MATRRREALIKRGDLPEGCHADDKRLVANFNMVRQRRPAGHRCHACPLDRGPCGGSAMVDSRWAAPARDGRPPGREYTVRKRADKTCPPSPPAPAKAVTAMGGTMRKRFTLPTETRDELITQGERLAVKLLENPDLDLDDVSELVGIVFGESVELALELVGVPDLAADLVGDVVANKSTAISVKVLGALRPNAEAVLERGGAAMRAGNFKLSRKLFAKAERILDRQMKAREAAEKAAEEAVEEAEEAEEGFTAPEPKSKRAKRAKPSE